MLKELKPDPNVESGYVDPTGCHWDTKLSYLCIAILGTCGCGDPSSIMKYVKEMLLKYVKPTDSQDTTCWNNFSYDDLPAYFFLSWADNKKFIEHGSSIGYSWMTPLGNELLKDIAEVEKEMEIAELAELAEQAAYANLMKHALPTSQAEADQLKSTISVALNGPHKQEKDDA